MRGQGTLRGQMLARVLMVGMFAVTAITLIASNYYYSQREREILQKRSIIQKLYEKELPKINALWQGDAEQMKARIEFSQILEGRDDVRWPKFNALLNAQSEFSNFSNLLVLRGDNRVLFRYGHEAHNIEVNPSLLASSWHYAEGAHELYRVYQLKIWLGAEGQGTLLLLKSMNNAAMNALAAPETQLNLYFNDQVLASSNGGYPKAIRPGMKDVIISNGMQLINTDLAWPGEGAQPVLIVQREFQEVYPIGKFLLRPFFVILAIISLFWLGLGRWLTRTVKRVEYLEAATNDYAKLGDASHTKVHLQQAAGQPDEISDLAKAMGALMQDIESRNLEQRAYLDTLAMLEEAVLEIGCQGLIQRASPGWSKLSHSDNAIGKRFYDFIHSDDRELVQTHCNELFSGEKNYATLRLRLDIQNSTSFTWIECRLVAFCEESGMVAGIRGVLRDITQIYLHEKKITHMALHDALTGLPNRILLEDRINVSMKQASRSLQKIGVCFIDLDHFKNVNDTMGHSSGDKLLLAFAERLRRQLREGDTVARWGGDEFVVLLPDMASEQDVRDFVMKVSEEVQTPLQIENAEFVVTFSMGVALYPDDAEDTETLFSQADRAMFFAKAQGRNQACFFRDMTANAIGKNELYIQNRLANAINSQQIQAWFQPIIATESGLCTGVEVLARWHDDEYGWVNPATFIPMAENLGLIGELGQQILLASLAAAQHWQKAGLHLTLAINVSKRQLFKPYFTERMMEEVVRHNVSPHMLILEITESIAMLDVEHAADRLLEIRQAGFQIALDDFGTGYSSLSQLHEMHVDELKIDISFVRRLHEPNGLSMTQAIINLAHSLDMKIVAEGVETEEAASKLKELGVTYLQGFLFAKPMPIDEFNEWINIYNNQ